MKNRFILPIFTFLLLTVISCSKDDPDITDKDKKDEPTETTAAFSTIGGCDSLKIYGDYNAGVPLTESNYLELPVKVTKAGTFVYEIQTDNGYGFKASQTFSEAGEYKLKLEGYGTPENISWDHLSIDIADLGCGKTIYVYEEGVANLDPLVIVFTGEDPYGGTYNEAFTQVRTGNGDKLWDIKRQSSVVPVVDNDVLYTVADGILYSQNVFTGEDIWSVTVDNTEIVKAPLTIDNNFIYVKSYNKLYAMNKADGSSAWSFGFDGVSDDSGTSASIVDGIIYAEHNNKIYAISSNGTELWTYTSDLKLNSEPVVVDGKLHISKYNGGIITLNASDGSLLWENSATVNYFKSPTVYNGKIYVISTNKIHCIGSRTGEYLWQIDHYSDWVCNVAIANDLVYTYDNDGKVIAFDINSGSEVFRSTYGTGEPQSPVVTNGVVFIASNRGFNLKNAFTGNKVWTQGILLFLNDLKVKKPPVVYNRETKIAAYPTESGMVQ